MPLPTAFLNNEQTNHLISEEQQYDVEELTKLIENDLPRLNIDQQAMYISVIATVEAGISSVYFIDGPGGTGKTFLYRQENYFQDRCFSVGYLFVLKINKYCRRKLSVLIILHLHNINLLIYYLVFYLQSSA